MLYVISLFQCAICNIIISEDLKYRYIDDLSALELVNLLNIGIQSHNIRQQVPNNIPTHNQIISNDKLETQKHVQEIANWSKNNLMKLNAKKCKNMIFNFSKNHQFSTSIELNDEKLETVSEMKVLGTWITDKLKWDKNTSEIVKDSNIRMQILHSSSKFTTNINHLKDIYSKFVRSKLETSSCVWHSSLTEKQKHSIERVQRSAFKVILKNRYISYEQACDFLNMDTLFDRRESKCLKFAKSCLAERHMKKIFPLNKNKSHHERYKVNKARTSRYKNSTVIHMQKLLNIECEENRKIKRKVDRACSSEGRLQDRVVYHCEFKNNK